MIDIEQIKIEIVDRLKSLDPEKIILFGSYAYGNPTEESDLDLMVVTRDDSYPESWTQRKELVRKISHEVYDIRKKVSVDLIVYTRAMFHDFSRSDSLFSKEILEKGRVLYGN